MCFPLPVEIRATLLSHPGAHFEVRCTLLVPFHPGELDQPLISETGHQSALSPLRGVSAIGPA